MPTPPSLIDAAAQGQVTAVVPHVHRTDGRLCPICQRLIACGHTCYSIYLMDWTFQLACWECGQAIQDHQGFTTPDSPDPTPPYGGGINPPGRPAGPATRQNGQ